MHLDDTELMVDDCVHEVLMLSPLDEYLEGVGDKGEEIPEKPLEDPTPTPLDNKKKKGKERRSWKKLWKKLCPKVSRASNIPNNMVQSVCFIDLCKQKVDSLLSLNFPVGSSLNLKNALGKTPSFEPPWFCNNWMLGSWH